MADALHTLGRLRTLQAKQARSALGQAMASEVAARDAVLAARADRVREASQATGPAGDPLAAAYAAWLPASARAIATAEAELTRRKAVSHQAASTLAACRAATKAVDVIAAERDRLEHKRLARKTQLKLDELGNRQQ